MTLAEKLFSGTEVLQRTGISIDHIEPNRIRLKMPLQGNIGGGGVMYAGSLFAPAEAAPGLLILNRFDPKRYAPTCAGVNIRFRRPAKTDVTLELTISDEQFAAIEAELEAKGKTQVEFNLEIVDANGEVVSIAETKYAIFKLG
ncbi:MAG: YiiD C-terminal domain-containing protein [Pseudoxanthomonas sp.]